VTRRRDFPELLGFRCCLVQDAAVMLRHDHVLGPVDDDDRNRRNVLDMLYRTVVVVHQHGHRILEKPSYRMFGYLFPRNRAIA